MKSQTDFFYGTGPGIVRVSDRIYQPIDVGSLLKRPSVQMVFPEWLTKALKIGALLLSGFLVGGFFGEFLVDNYFSLYHSLSTVDSLRIILIVGGIGMLLSGIIGLLSRVPVPE